MKKIAILGAGYGGVAAAKTLHKIFKKNKDVQITVYDRNPFHTLMTELHEVAGGRTEPDSVQVSLEKIFGGMRVEVKIETITNIRFKDNVLVGKEGEYAYDYLVLGPGAEPEYFGISGAKDHSFSLWSFDDALVLRRHIEDQLLKASREPNEARRSQALTFTVAGAGFTGMEMLGELLEWKAPLCHRYGVDEAEVTIVLVEAMTEILPILPKKLRENTMKFLAKKGAVVHLNTPITEVRADGITVKGGTVIPTDTLIWTCGVRGCEFAGKLDFTGGKEHGKSSQTEEETNLKFNILKKARLRSNEYMQSVDYDNVYVVGDVLWFSEKNRTLPQVVETALQTAECAGHNIAADITGGTKKAFRSNYHGFMVSVGSKFAVAHVMGMVLTGFMAMAMKHLVNFHYLWSVAGVNSCWEYAQHHFFVVKNGRSQVGNQLANKTPTYWLLPIRVALGAMWVVEVLEKVFKGWLDPARGPVSGWMFTPGTVQAGWAPADGATAATAEAATETVAAVADAATAASGVCGGRRRCGRSPDRPAQVHGQPHPPSRPFPRAVDALVHGHLREPGELRRASVHGDRPRGRRGPGPAGWYLHLGGRCRLARAVPQLHPGRVLHLEHRLDDLRLGGRFGWRRTGARTRRLDHALAPPLVERQQARQEDLLVPRRAPEKISLPCPPFGHPFPSSGKGWPGCGSACKSRRTRSRPTSATSFLP